MLLLYLISLYSSLAGLGHKGRKRLKKSQLKNPQRTAPYKKYFLGVFGNWFVPSIVVEIKNFKENLIGLSTGPSLIKNKNEPAISFVKSRGLTCYNSPVGGLGKLDRLSFQ